MNQVQLIGRMARDPELRRTENGTPVVSFALAVDRRFQRDAVDFIDCVAWRGTTEFLCKYFAKGRVVAAVGRMQTRTWKDKYEQTRKVTELKAEVLYFGDTKKVEQMAESDPDMTGNGFGELEEDDGELPF